MMKEQEQRGKAWRRAQRDKKIQERKDKIQNAEGGKDCRWLTQQPEHDGQLSKSKAYMGPHDVEDKTSNRDRRNFKQTPDE